MRNPSGAMTINVTHSYIVLSMLITYTDERNGSFFLFFFFSLFFQKEGGQATGAFRLFLPVSETQSAMRRPPADPAGGAVQEGIISIYIVTNHICIYSIYISMIINKYNNI